MKKSHYLRLFILLSTLYLLGGSSAISAVAQDQPVTQKASPSQQSDQKQDNNRRKANEKQVLKELATPYKKWLSEDVVYIITDAERKAFLELQTNEEREQFIEEFWQRRNPDPDSVDNPVKEEHYRRIAYANEHFASGIAGWRTDRGRIYIMYGKPDTLESHTQGEDYERPLDQGGGQTKTYGFEDWTYHYIEGIGENVELEFVDPTGTGEFRLTTDPSEKDALLYVPGAGLTLAEQEGMSSKAARFTNTDGTHMAPSPYGARSSKLDEFSRLELEAKIWQPPPVKFKDLEEVVSSRIVREQIKFEYRFDFLRVTGDTVLVPITVQIPNNQLSFQSKDGVHSATLNLFARVSSLSGRTVQTFEDTIRRDFPDSLLQASLRSASIYQKAVPLRPGLYRLDVVLKDTTSNNIGVVNTRLAVPPFDDDKLQASTLILADEISPVAAKDIGLGMFVIGSMKVRPKLDQSFTTSQPIGVYFQIYNLKIDDKTHKNSASIEIQIRQGDQSIKHVVQSSEQLHQSGEQMTVQESLPAQTLTPGKYRIEIKTTDAVANQNITRSADFTITSPPNEKIAAQTSSAR
ncbi:MAG: GWxTD domain-containing protein [Acidobacteria bacterium]|nr:MAG: GWxTD domain-containing protein [Acidobacteriota bacterium]